jgi:hypothetical protein
MGLLDIGQIGAAVDNLKRRVKLGLLDPALTYTRANEDAKASADADNDRLQRQFKSALPETRKQAGQETRDQSYDLMTQLLGIGAIKPLYHGSPHKFDKFDMSKIGTGEGAQAYGHGLYLADDPRVASSYKTAGTGGVFSDSDKVADAVHKLIGPYKDGRVPFGPLQTMYTKEQLRDVFAKDIGGAISKVPQGVLNKLDSELVPPGNLYTAEMRWPDAAREASDPLGPQHFLDWDAPVSKQSDSVKNALAKRGIDVSGIDPGDASLHQKYGVWEPKDLTGERAYFSLFSRANDPAASKSLLDIGIPGIRYLDGGSRGSGTGTSNYVIFDDALARILSRE